MNLIQLLKSVSKKEWYTIIFVWVVITLLWLLPIVIAQFTIPFNKVISGIIDINPYDYPVYFSYLASLNRKEFMFVILIACLCYCVKSIYPV